MHRVAVVVEVVTLIILSALAPGEPGAQADSGRSQFVQRTAKEIERYYRK